MKKKIQSLLTWCRVNILPYILVSFMVIGDVIAYASLVAIFIIYRTFFYFLWWKEVQSFGKWTKLKQMTYIKGRMKKQGK